MTDHIERTKRMIEVMQAYVDGKRIEVKGLYFNTLVQEPWWDWCSSEFVVAKTPDTINWDHVAPEFKYMARDGYGNACLYEDKPTVSGFNSYACTNKFVTVKGHASYRKGTADWKESLVIRPGCD